MDYLKQFEFLLEFGELPEMILKNKFVFMKNVPLKEKHKAACCFCMTFVDIFIKTSFIFANSPLNSMFESFHSRKDNGDEGHLDFFVHYLRNLFFENGEQYINEHRK